MGEFGRKLGAFFLDILQVVVLALSLFVISYLFLFQPHQVRGSSMVPNFEDDDFLLTDKISYHFRQPERGEIIIFKAPASEPCSAEECEYIKRIIGLPGEKIQIQEETYLINNQKLSEKYLPPNTKTEGGIYLTPARAITLAPDEYFVSGDNRSYSHDSRSFGPIKKEAIVGKTWLRYWPPDKMGIIPKPKD